MERKLIVNADDFGLTAGVNAAVAECCERGVLRSATIMANAPAFDDAVKIAKGRKNLGVGIHFVLTRFQPLSETAKLPELTGRNGALPSGPGELLKIALSRRGVRDELRRELFAQAERVFDSGIIPTHFDSHKHVHIIPAVLEIMIEIARRWSVKWIRDPFESPAGLMFLFDMEKGKRGQFIRQYAAALCTSPARLAFHSLMSGSGICSPDYFHGISATGLMTRKFIRRFSERVKPGINELMTHPGYVDDDLKILGTRLIESRAREKEIVASEELKELLQRNSIIISNFGEVNK